MKVWQKAIVVVSCGGAIWGLSFLAGQKPEMSTMIATVNAAIMAVCSFFTGYPNKEA